MRQKSNLKYDIKLLQKTNQWVCLLSSKKQKFNTFKYFLQFLYLLDIFSMFFYK